MKKQKNMFEVIIGPDGKLDDLFDDCPLCQQLKKDLASGKVQQVPIQSDEYDVWEEAEKPE